jgi:hypothetical protein
MPRGRKPGTVNKVKPVEPVEALVDTPIEEAESYKKNKLCLKCVNSCKQRRCITIVQCPFVARKHLSDNDLQELGENTVENNA